MDELRKRLIDFLNEKDMTLAKAAVLFDCNAGTLSKIINKKTNPNRRTEYKLRKILAPETIQ